MAEIPKFIENPLRYGIDLAHRNLIYPWLTRGEGKIDRDIAHERALKLMEDVQDNEIVSNLLLKIFAFNDPILETNFCGISLPNPAGLAAGFDKNVRIPKFIESQGAGFETAGSITKIKYEGNPRPRIFTLPENDSLINRMGFPGNGGDEAENKVRKYYREHGLKYTSRNPLFTLPNYLFPSRKHFGLFLNFAASAPSFKAGLAIPHYVEIYKQILDYGDGHQGNISSPNTDGVTGIQEPDEFEELTSEIEIVRRESARPDAPLGWKFSPDFNRSKREKDITIGLDHGANFFVLTNTTTNPDLINTLSSEVHKGQPGGYSGGILTDLALQISHEVFEFTGGSVPLIRAGGLMCAKDMWDSATYGGATLHEFIAAYVLRETSTPNFFYYILRDFSKAMRVEGMTGMDDFKALHGKKVPFPKI